MDEQYARRQKEMEAEVRETKEELACVKGDCKEKYSKLDRTIDEELELFPPCPPKGDVIVKLQKKENAWLLDCDAKLKEKENEETSEEPSNIELGKDMWKQLTRVCIPVCNGDKRSYESWKAAFMACVDKVPATAEYKLFQLKKHLPGEALAAVESSGHSVEAYEAAKSRRENSVVNAIRSIYTWRNWTSSDKFILETLRI